MNKVRGQKKIQARRKSLVLVAGKKGGPAVKQGKAQKPAMAWATATSSGQAVYGLSDRDSIREYVEKTKKASSADNRQALLDSGIYTQKGELTKRFR